MAAGGSCAGTRISVVEGGALVRTLSPAGVSVEEAESSPAAVGVKQHRNNMLQQEGSEGCVSTWLQAPFEERSVAQPPPLHRRTIIASQQNGPYALFLWKEVGMRGVRGDHTCGFTETVRGAASRRAPVAKIAARRLVLCSATQIRLRGGTAEPRRYQPVPADIGR